MHSIHGLPTVKNEYIELKSIFRRCCTDRATDVKPDSDDRLGSHDSSNFHHFPRLELYERLTSQQPSPPTWEYRQKLEVTRYMASLQHNMAKSLPEKG